MELKEGESCVSITRKTIVVPRYFVPADSLAKNIKKEPIRPGLKVKHEIHITETM
jgi:hypothetical protein